MRPRCPKCGSVPAYEEGGSYVCMMGGHRWPINGVKPILITKVEDDMAGKRKPCVNCGRDMVIASYGLCGGCYAVVVKMGAKPGTAAWKQGLTEAKAHFLDPNYRPHKSHKQLVNKAVAPIENTHPISKTKFKSTVMPTSSDFKKQSQSPSLESMPMSGEAAASLYRRIEEMTLDRDFHLAVAARLTKAIEALQE